MSASHRIAAAVAVFGTAGVLTVGAAHLAGGEHVGGTEHGPVTVAASNCDINCTIDEAAHPDAGDNAGPNYIYLPEQHKVVKVF